MKQKFLPYFLLFCAVGLSFTAAYYSVLGLSILFASVAIPVMVMGSFLEISKIAIATYLHDQWKKTYTGLKIYLTTALVVLSFITSLGIYGLLTTGFQENIAKLNISDKQIANVEVKKERFEEIKTELTTEKSTLDKDISQLRNALSTNTTTQSIDRKTGQVTTKANTGNRKAFEAQLKEAQTRRDNISSKIDALNDSITNLDVQVLNMETETELGNELGAVKYVSELTGSDVKDVANWFILLIIFVFDPLAIVLVIATNQAFNNLKPKTNIYGEPKPIEPEPFQEPNPQPIDNSEEINRLTQEINRIQNSGATGRRVAAAVEPLQQRLRDLKKDSIVGNQKAGHPLPKGATFFQRIQNKEFEFSHFYWQAKFCEIEINQKHQEYRGDIQMLIEKHSVDLARRKRLWEDFNKVEAELLAELKKGFLREFVMTSQEYDSHIIEFDGTTEKFYMYCLKTFDRSGKPVERRGRPPKNKTL